MDREQLQQYPCPEAVLELGPLCPVTCDLLTACMAHPEQVSAEGRRFAAKFVFQRAMETVLNVDVAVEVATTVMAKEENDPVFTTRLTSCLDLTYVERENLIPMKHINVTHFLKRLYTVLKNRKVSVRIFNTELPTYFLNCMLTWCHSCFEKPNLYSVSAMDAFHGIINRNTALVMRKKFPRRTTRLRGCIAKAVSRGPLQKGVRLLMWEILQFFPRDD
ncbi:uncharacterized protein LOC120353704 [Nilaparvata lugens]|uniref:uncharacterized protein LOC120353704 n=1 Tax=Nilaparvata lugens TaxID=108931 RepID=UPI00193E0379|nr:uncharacterized protein LOC120353704 [Nilaparvata lugens]